jgi:hypothetical protein
MLTRVAAENAPTHTSRQAILMAGRSLYITPKVSVARAIKPIAVSDGRKLGRMDLELIQLVSRLTAAPSTSSNPIPITIKKENKRSQSALQGPFFIPQFQMVFKANWSW